MNENDLIERQLDSRLIFDGRILHVYDDAVTLPNGGVASRELIRHIGAVCVIPVLRDGRAVVERQYRYPVGEVLTEIPAGKLDAPDEDPEEAARRELREETGYTCDELIALGVFYPAPAYSSEKIHMYLARGLHRPAKKKGQKAPKRSAHRRQVFNSLRPKDGSAGRRRGNGSILSTGCPGDAGAGPRRRCGRSGCCCADCAAGSC